MSVIAVAGGTGGVGRTIVDELVAQGKHNVIILSRRCSGDLEKKLKAPIVAVDYSDVASLVHALTVHTVTTIISTLSVSSSIEHELNLIDAASRCNTLKRFIPSSFSAPATEEQRKRWLVVQNQHTAIDTLARTKLEYTAIYIGFFLDYWAMPHVPTHLGLYASMIDVPNRRAALPGDGNDVMTTITSQDAAKFTVALLDTPQGSWPKQSFVVGERLTTRGSVKVLEEVLGTTFEIIYDSAATLEAGECTELENYNPFYEHLESTLGAPRESVRTYISLLAFFTTQGVFDFQGKPTLNETFPEIRPTTARELFQKAWGRNQG